MLWAVTASLSSGYDLIISRRQRSEEHTSELQSQSNLVCRLLLEKKKPTIFGDVDPQMRVAQEEIFGPTTALIRVRDVDEAIRVSNGIKYGLSSSIFTRDVNTAFRAMRDLQAGITYINAGTIGAEVHLPFGGTKDTR